VVPIDVPWSLFGERSQRTVVILAQVYVPDPASLGQYMHDVAMELVRRGTRVIVFTADRGYDDPRRRYRRYETRDGVHVVRLPFSSFGKRNLATRLAGGGVFLLEAASIALLVRRIDHVLVSTSPPMCGIAGVALSRARRVPLTHWVMDLNPDQIVATGRFDASDLPVRAFDWMNARVLDRAQRVVVPDEYMRERIQRKHAVGNLTVLPLWQPTDPRPHTNGINPFRVAHQLGDARIVMYSGNLSPVHPVTTLLEAARRFRDSSLQFVFIGGGLGRSEIERKKREYGLTNVVTLPYQPLEVLPDSLSAADVHLVAMGNDMVGIVHPCKIYGAMAVGRPVLALGPRRSHIADLVLDHRIGWHVEHGDVEGVARALHEVATLERSELDAMGRRARRVMTDRFRKATLLESFCDFLA
jgi:glycosyltransferase involved in cell wall biosynthesis